MRPSLTLKLSLNLVLLPSSNIQFSNMKVQGFGDQGADGDRAVGSVGVFIFLVTFEENICINSVDFSYFQKGDIIEKGIEKKMEMFDAC